jgi:hypothetical protein
VESVGLLVGVWLCRSRGLGIGLDMVGRDMGMMVHMHNPAAEEVGGSMTLEYSDMCGRNRLVVEGTHSGEICKGLVLVGSRYTLDDWC